MNEEQAWPTRNPHGLRKRTIPCPRPGSGTTSNQVSPGTIQEILDTGDQDLIDQAFD